MRFRTFLIPSAALALSVAAIAANESAYRPAATDAKTAEAVKAADAAWGKAEENGDEAYVDWLLMPGYRSIGHAGEITSKETILARTRKQKSSPDAAAKVAAWKAAHPIRDEVQLFGDTALLTWVSTKPGSMEPISSVDVFVYREDHWHAIYSQHTDVGN